MTDIAVPAADLLDVDLIPRVELHDRTPSQPLKRRVSLGLPVVMSLSAADINDPAPADFLLSEVTHSRYCVLHLVVNFYPDPGQPLVEAAVGVLLDHNGPADLDKPIAWSISPTKATTAVTLSSKIGLTAKLGIIEPQLEHGTQRQDERTRVLGLGERQSDPEWRFTGWARQPIEGIHTLTTIVKTPVGVSVTASIRVAAAVQRRHAGLIRYRAALPPELASITWTSDDVHGATLQAPQVPAADA